MILDFFEGLEKLLMCILYVKAEKCELYLTKISFSDFVISEGIMKMNWANVQAERDWSTPSSTKDVQRFPGFANF